MLSFLKTETLTPTGDIIEEKPKANQNLAPVGLSSTDEIKDKQTKKQKNNQHP